MGNRCPICNRLNLPQAQYCIKCNAPLHLPARRIPLFPTGKLASNSIIGQHYRIIRLLDKGGMSAVYEAADIRLHNCLVAIKEMSLSKLSPRDAIEAFKREAHMLAKLDHPNLPRIYDHFLQDGRWYLAMDFIEGETLDHYLYKTMGGPLSIKEILDIGVQLCSVLSYLHKHRPPIIFRDLKPSNIMLTPAGRLYLIDFGIARHFKAGQARDTSQLGTQGYFAPELTTQQSNPRSDIYSLGVTLHELLTAIDPVQKTFYSASLHSQRRSTPPELEALVMSMLDEDPQKRPPSMVVIRQTLQKIAAQWSASMRSTVQVGREKKTRRSLIGFTGWRNRVSTLYVETGLERGNTYELPQDVLNIGRDPKNDICLENDQAISRFHAALRSSDNGGFTLRDKRSVNGTFINGRRLNSFQSYALTDEDRIKLGETTLVFKKQ